MDIWNRYADCVGEQLGFVYNETEGANAYGYLEQVRRLPKDAEEVL